MCEKLATAVLVLTQNLDISRCLQRTAKKMYKDL